MTAPLLGFRFLKASAQRLLVLVESPVFNFLNSLSPMRTVKYTRISQSINPLTFASLPSVFASPRVKESRFIPRHQLSDVSKPEFSSGYQTTLDVRKVNAVVENKQSNEQKENVDPRESDDGDMFYDCSKFVVDYPDDYKCDNPDSEINAKEMVDYGCNALSEENIEVVSQADQNKEVPSCDWKNMMGRRTVRRRRCVAMLGVLLIFWVISSIAPVFAPITDLVLILTHYLLQYLFEYQ